MIRGATALKSARALPHIEREVIIPVVNGNEISELTELIEDIVPHAFLIISDAHEVLGEGFQRRS